MATRSYVSPLRASDAAATRSRIVEAAARLFVRDGYAATPMRAIALEAGVSQQTVHLHGPKHLLLIAAFERSFAGDEGNHSLAERPALVEIMSTPDTGAAIEAYLLFLAEANARSAHVTRAIMAAADADPAVRAAYADLEDRRRRDMSIAAGWFVDRGLVAAADADRAADLLALYTGPDAYLQLVATAGWTSDAYRAWLRAMLAGLTATLG